MTFDQILLNLGKKEPRVLDDESTVEFKAPNLRRLLRQVYEQGEAEGAKRVAPAAAENRRSPSSSLDDLFSDLGFRNRR